MKRYINLSLLYAVLAMVGGVFYREFTKFNGFTGKTSLGVVHTHYFLLGMVFFLLLLLLEKNFAFTGAKTGRVLVVYQVGLNLTAVMLAVRGVTQEAGVIHQNPVSKKRNRGDGICRPPAVFWDVPDHSGLRLIWKNQPSCWSSQRCISARMSAKAAAVSGLSVAKSSSFHSQPCSATARRLSG